VVFKSVGKEILQNPKKVLSNEMNHLGYLTPKSMKEKAKYNCENF